MRSCAHFFILILAASLLASCGVRYVGTSNDSMVPHITTSASAEKRVEPNIAIVTFAILTRAPAAEKARDENAKKSAAINDKLHELKIGKDDLQSVDYNIHEVVNYDKGNSKIEGYEVVSRMRLKLADVKAVGKIVDQLVPLGANRVEKIEFDVKERDEIYKSLLEEATLQAKDKASHMAEAAGLGKITVVEVREENSGPVYAPQMMKAEYSDASGGATTPIPGMAVLRAQVFLTARAK